MEIGEGADAQSIEYIHPMAFLNLLSSTSTMFGQFFSQCLGSPSAPANIILYCDETRPGNQLRPDCGRAMQAIYWTVSQFPDWFRVRALGWYPFAYVSSRWLKKARISMSSLFVMILNVFWDPTPLALNMETTGFNMLIDGSWTRVSGVFAAFLGDEKGIKEFYSCKGAGGNKCCITCKNVVHKHCEHINHPYFVDVLDISPNRFDFHTPESVYEYADAVEVAVRTNAPNRKELGRMLGLTYDSHGALWNKDMRRILKGSDTVYWDWQHSLVASGGVAQWHVAAFVYKLEACGIQRAQLDDFVTLVELPSTMSKLPKTFFVDRFRHKRGCNMRGFASETMTAVYVLMMYVERVLRPIGALPEHCMCLEKLVRVLDLLRSGDGMIDHLDALDARILDHLGTMQRKYPQLFRGRKPHYMTHIGRCARRVRRNLSCFAPERRHRICKTRASYIYRNMGASLIRADLCALLNMCKDPSMFQPYFLKPAVLELRAGSCDTSVTFDRHMSHKRSGAIF